MNSHITISGNIISELSEKIPSNIIALNELIKNSYDAGAPEVNVTINTLGKTLIIQDNGSGMNKKDIDTLFHISSSEKIYGQINEYGRITQGSKGLGFLSVFKFGDHVEWQTKKDKGYIFSLKRSDMLKIYDLSKYQVEIIEDDKITKGTQITISLDDYNNQTLKEFFSVEQNYKKIIHALDDDKFIIRINIDGTDYTNETKTSFSDNLPENQLYRVKYNSIDCQIEFYYHNFPIIVEQYAFDSDAYMLDIDLIIFQLPPYGKDKIDNLFFNSNGDLSPLIYVNSNLFNNYSIFNPNIMKNIKNSQVLNQMIGHIRIISSDSQLSFNSDRTQFLQNKLTDSIIIFLADINKKIQEIGSKYKKYLLDLDYLAVNELPSELNDCKDTTEFTKYIKPDFEFKDKVSISRQDNKVIFSIFNTERILQIKPKKKHVEEAEKSVPVVINLEKKDLNIMIPSKQIALLSYISSVYNSKGEKVNNIDEIEIWVDNELVPSKILPSIDKSCQKKIEYKYHDDATGLYIKQMNITFYQNSANIVSAHDDVGLIVIPAKKEYTINYSYTVGRLIEQINALDGKKQKEVIACSMRAVLELSIDCIRDSNKFNDLFSGVTRFEDRVLKVKEYITGKDKYLSIIANETNIEFMSLKNLLSSISFESAVSTAHLGAHKSTYLLTDMAIDNLAKCIGIFVVFVNEMINNEGIS